MADLPDPFRSFLLPDCRPAHRRVVPLCGSPVEVVWLPDRAQRRADGGARPFRGDLAPRIIAEEALWTATEPAAVLTPNRFPFARAAAILWSGEDRREASGELLRLAAALAARGGGTALMNTVGAAATITRAHVHLCGERLPFLTRLAVEPCDPASLGLADPGVALARAAPPFPGLLLRVAGPLDRRIAAAARLLALRSAAAANWLDDGGASWVALRRAETPAPAFPYPLGCAELWGRWCFEAEDTARGATAEHLAEALRRSLWPI